MFRDIRKSKIFNRRTLFVSGAQASLVSILAMRLSYLQIFKHKEYASQSNSNSVKPMIKPAGRGIVLDRKGRALVENEINYRLYLYLEDKKNVENLVGNLVEVLDLSAKERLSLLKKVRRAKRRSMISLIDSLTFDDMARIEVNSYRLAGASIESEFVRRYPFAEETAHFLGYVAAPSGREIKERDKLLYLHPSFRIGKTGLERSYERHLRGKYGVKYVEVNALERPIRTISVQEPKEGAALDLTIDLDLQKFATKKLLGKAASTVVMDVKTGEILSYVSTPTFDGNRFVEGVSQEYWDKLRNDARHPMNNRVISAIYPPGSTFKLMTALAALEAGLDPLKKYRCNGHFDSGKRRFHCWEAKGHGEVDMVEGIMKSCNVYFYNIAQQIGMERISKMARRFGYGERVGVGLYGENSGNVPDDKWKRKVFGRGWVGGDTLNSAIGQGFVLATPIQMALAAARVANGGVAIEPYLVKNYKAQEQFERLRGDLLVKKEYLDIVKEGMSRVVNDKDGTAYYRRIWKRGFEMAGKTGTSQVISKREKEMSRAEMMSDLTRNHAIFVGFAPVVDPKYAVSVVVEHGGSGSGAAAPVGRDLLLRAQELLV